MKKIWILVYILLPMIASAQGGDKSKVMKEIEIAENILSSLLEQELEETEHVVWVGFNNGPSQVEGTYIEDFGALFTIGGGRNSFRGISLGDGMGSNFNYNFNGIAKIHGRRPYVIRLDSDGKKKKGQAAADEEANEEAVVETFDPFEFFQKVSRDFFVDYGYLIKGIKPSEKVLIRYILKNDVAVVISGWNSDQANNWSTLKDKDWDSEPGVYTAMVLKSDIDALQSGNLSEAQFEKKITFTKGVEDAETETKDMKLINSIFSRLYKEDLSGSSCITSRGSPRSEYIPGLGLVVNMRMNTRCRDRSGRFGRLELFREGQSGAIIMGDEDEGEEDGETQHEEERENPDEHYPAFLSTLKENIVEYGSIARSLQADEVLVFKVEFNGCRDCKLIPDNISITAKQSTLAAYRQGKVALDKAVEQLRILE